MNFKVIKTMFSTIGVCAIVVSAFALTGCSEQAREWDTTSICEPGPETSGKYLAIGEKSTDTFSESAGEAPTSSGEEQNGYPEIDLDLRYLETVEQDRLYVHVFMHMDDEALRAEYEKEYPGKTEDYRNWGRFLSDSGEQLIRDFVCDYNIDYEKLDELDVFKMGGRFGKELDKSIVSLMLNDSRVAQIVYYPNGLPGLKDF